MNNADATPQNIDEQAAAVGAWMASQLSPWQLGMGPFAMKAQRLGIPIQVETDVSGDGRRAEQVRLTMYFDRDGQPKSKDAPRIVTFRSRPAGGSDVADL